MHSKNALSNLIKRYKAVLSKCNILNTFGTLALASGLLLSPMLISDVNAVYTNPSGTTVPSMEATNDPILENYGTISGGQQYVLGPRQVWAGMFGYSLGNASYNFSNFGTITINKPAGTNEVYGMYAYAINGDHKLSNSGTIRVSGSSNVYGMYAEIFSGGNHTLTNSGTISVSGFGHNIVYGMSASTRFGNGDHTLSNSGTMTVSSTSANANGMYASASATGNHSLTNSGTIRVSGTLNNTKGMYAYANNGSHSLTNSGTIRVSGTGNTVYGMHANANNGNHKLTNSGTMTVSGDNDVYGMYADINGNHNLTNSGTIRVSGDNDVYGMYASANNGNHNLSNSGTITVSGTDNVYGMRVRGTGTHNLSNTGYISANAKNGKAYEAYGNNSYNVNTWATTLRDWSANDTVFGATNNMSVTFNNSRLIFRPGTAAQGFALGKVYQIANMVSIANIGGTMQLQNIITGNVASIETEVPFLKAVRGGTANAPTVKLESNVSEDTTPGIASMQQAIGQIQAQFNNISKSLRNALVRVYRQANLTTSVNTGSELLPQNKWDVFFTPYVISTSNSDLDFSGNNVGITGGFNYHINEKFFVGMHLDFNAGTFHGDILDTYSKSTSIALGVHAAYNITPEWYVRAQFTASMNQSNNTYETGAALPITADAAVNSTSLQAAVSTGYFWVIGQGHSLNTEIGVSYMNLHTFSYDINWDGPSATGGVYDFFYDDSNYSAFYATFNLDWRSEWIVSDDNSIAILAGLGVRQKLSTNEIETSMQALGSKYTTRMTEDSTTFLANVGAEWKINDFSLMVQYNGEFGNTQTSHGGSVMVKLEF